MTTREMEDLEGIVGGTVYSNLNIDITGFLNEHVRFTLEKDGTRKCVVLTGKYIPPIQNGLYAEVKAIRTKFPGQDRDTFLAKYLWLKHSKQEKELFEYCDLT
ncbi:MAG: hypothetical protein AABX96_00160 [Nanoarchaeota archaeon]